MLIAPTAGGKTEAAFFPVLSRMVEEDLRGLSVLYVTPLKALPNNLQPRLEQYAAWRGRTVGLWHGDVGPRRRMVSEQPGVLLTAPESLEAVLVSTRVDHLSMFADLRTVVLDALHAFAGAYRGWHLLAVIERLQRLPGQRGQRIGLSATVGNPQEMLRWLQGSRPEQEGEVVTEEVPSSSTDRVEVTLDYVGAANAAELAVTAVPLGEAAGVLRVAAAGREAGLRAARAGSEKWFESIPRSVAAPARRPVSMRWRPSGPRP